MGISLFLSCALQALFGYGLSDVCVCVCVCEPFMQASTHAERERERERERESVCKILQVPPLITDQIQSLSFHVLHIPKYVALAPRCVAATVSHHNVSEQMGRIPAT